MDDTSEDSANSTTGQNKVARLIGEYGLDGLGDELEDRWTASGNERMSLRSLADYFNQRLLKTVVSRTGAPLSGEVENLYSLLTDADVSKADATRTHRQLEREGIDVDQLLTDFVSYGAIRTYLKDFRGAEYEQENRDRIAVEAKNLQRLRGRTAAVIESKLEQLANSDDLEIGDHRTIVKLNVLCEDCGQRYNVDELLEQGSCDCTSFIIQSSGKDEPT